MTFTSQPRSGHLTRAFCWAIILFYGQDHQIVYNPTRQEPKAQRIDERRRKTTHERDATTATNTAQHDTSTQMTEQKNDHI